VTKDVKVYGQRIKLYRVRRFAAAWCSDRNLAYQIGERREQNLRKLRLNTNEVRALVRL